MQIHHRKNLILLEDIDIEKIRCSSMVSSGEKNRNILLVANSMIRKLTIAHNTSTSKCLCKMS